MVVSLCPVSLSLSSLILRMLNNTTNAHSLLLKKENNIINDRKKSDFFSENKIFRLVANA